MIIDSTYFLTKELFIPNAVSQPSIGSNAPTSLIQLNEVIDYREDELLLKALGWAQLVDLKAQFEIGGAWKVGALQKWKDLVDGKDDWKGLRFTIGTKKYSVIAYYTFFYYLGSDFRQYTTTGIQIPEASNSTSQTPNETQVRAWMKFLEMYQGQRNINGSNHSFFSNWNGLGLTWLGYNNQNGISLYDFMSKNSEDYSISSFVFERPINSMNL